MRRWTRLRESPERSAAKRSTRPPAAGRDDEAAAPSSGDLLAGAARGRSAIRTGAGAIDVLIAASATL